ncbi:Queuine tRNA-ribosyltransferase [Mycena indigotica]|uniref:tRNA-guanosine(34) queuine transglycosylase n=1 Tax=Mycena indigotica TaxID=2126181 RepID=A0A8H6WGA3_9AGAR|nr:Queuine tRNA-ribosyltransferase [Mycena indigotica]KAF7315631.1 Queuine tRNA-ribosyltransferase [Mycena indigotica]
MAKFEILARCPTTRARVSRLTLSHGETALPTFMPVATQAAIKGLTSQQVESLGISLILNNTYHLNLRPGVQILAQAGGAHKFQGWNKNLLTDSGGFQFVSLSKFAKITEEGKQTILVFWRNCNSHFGRRLILQPLHRRANDADSPEESISIQHAIGAGSFHSSTGFRDLEYPADIIMQLDDVVPSLTPDRARVEEAMERSVRWLDRCIAFHNASGKQTTQNLFAIVQGGLDHELRDRCLKQMVERSNQVAGFAVGGLSGGEEKDVFWRIVKQCAEKLPEEKPRYCMGVGFAEGNLSSLVQAVHSNTSTDLLVCVALGVDMADCVFPTRTARFGVALTRNGPLNLRLAKHATDFSPIEKDCPCPTCSQGTSRAMLHHIVTRETAAAHAVTIHNIVFQAQVMGGARDAIIAGTFPQYLKAFFAGYFADAGYPEWCVNALQSVGVDLLEGLDPSEVKIIPGSGAKWEYSTNKSKTK